MAFDGSLLSRPSPSGREQPVREALLVQYAGVYAAPLPLPLLNGDPARADEPLTYKLVRPSKVTAALIGPDGVPRVLEDGVAHDPGSYTESFASYDAEGTWRWQVQAVDDLGRPSTATRTFRYDTTLHDVAVPKLGHGSLTVRFTLARQAKVRLRIETRGGIVMRDLGVAALGTGPQRLVWDGGLPQGTRAYTGNYVAHVLFTSAVGASEISVPFAYRR
jgi:hypothetical protein